MYISQLFSFLHFSQSYYQLWVRLGPPEASNDEPLGLLNQDYVLPVIPPNQQCQSTEEVMHVIKFHFLLLSCDKQELCSMIHQNEVMQCALHDNHVSVLLHNVLVPTLMVGVEYSVQYVA